ncbi:MAG TPA: GntR family transcriptional regulator [Kiritimatiellia bacterium]|nr:GntR family transcriptional regulator [Kiritimatiellia bacterium]
MLPFSITFQPGVPVTRQIVFAVKKAVVTGHLVPGDRFPSIRQLSQELRINPNTAQKVVRNLADEGLLSIVPGIGTVVATAPPPSSDQKKNLLQDQLEQLVIEAKRMSLSQEDVLAAVTELWDSNKRQR